MTERRCPVCNKLVAVTSADYVGAVAFFCHRCKNAFGGADPVDGRIDCRCKRRLHTGSITAGSVRTVCSRCRVLVEITANGSRWVETPRQKRPKPRPVPLTDEQLVVLVADRWTMFNAHRAWQRADVAVGIRFDVFNRDGFRCTYCGRTPADGILLEVDHVIPRAAGGLDELTNLVTACRDCNRGKSSKLLLTG